MEIKEAILTTSYISHRGNACTMPNYAGPAGMNNEHTKNSEYQATWNKVTWVWSEKMSIIRTNYKYKS